MTFNLFSDLPTFNSNNFKCTSSSSGGATHTCDKVYDGNSDTRWRTQRGKGNNSWIDIQFNTVINISKIEIQQPSSGSFKKISMLFSNTQSQIMTLSDASQQWNSAMITPPVETKFLRLTASIFRL